MAIKKAVKKVEIADESILNLKGKGKSSTKSGVNFSVNRIEEDDDVMPVPVDFGHAPKFDEVEEIPKEPVRETSVATAEALIDRHPRPPKFDQEELHKRMENFAEKLEKAVIKVSPSESSLPSNVAADPKDLIKVKFEKFVQLVATKDFLSILERNKDEDVVLSSNLLTELASAVEEKGEKKSPVIFLVGLAIGVIITYLLINR